MSQSLSRSAVRGLTPSLSSGNLNFPNNERRHRRLCLSQADEKSGVSCFCHRCTSAGCGYILAEQRPGVREAPAASRWPGSVVPSFCA